MIIGYGLIKTHYCDYIRVTQIEPINLSYKVDRALTFGSMRRPTSLENLKRW